MTAVDFHRIASGLLLVWGLLGIALLIAPSALLRLATRDRITLSTRGAVAIRILGIVNAYGAFHIFWFGR